MTDVTITRHGETRMSQRGFRETDLAVILKHGTDIGRDRIMLKKQEAAKVIRDLKKQIADIARAGVQRVHDALEAIRYLKKQIADIDRLTGKVIVVADGRLITAYHTSKRQAFN